MVYSTIFLKCLSQAQHLHYSLTNLWRSERQVNYASNSSRLSHSQILVPLQSLPLKKVTLSLSGLALDALDGGASLGEVCWFSAALLGLKHLPRFSFCFRKLEHLCCNTFFCILPIWLTTNEGSYESPFRVLPTRALLLVKAYAGGKAVGPIPYFSSRSKALSQLISLGTKSDICRRFASPPLPSSKTCVDHRRAVSPSFGQKKLELDCSGAGAGLGWLSCTQSTFLIRNRSHVGCGLPVLVIPLVILNILNENRPSSSSSSLATLLTQKGEDDGWEARFWSQCKCEWASWETHCRTCHWYPLNSVPHATLPVDEKVLSMKFSQFWSGMMSAPSNLHDANLGPLYTMQRVASEVWVCLLNGFNIVMDLRCTVPAASPGVSVENWTWRSAQPWKSLLCIWFLGLIILPGRLAGLAATQLTFHIESGRCDVQFLHRNGWLWKDDLVAKNQLTSPSASNTRLPPKSWSSGFGSPLWCQHRYQGYSKHFLVTARLWLKVKSGRMGSCLNNKIYKLTSV